MKRAVLYAIGLVLIVAAAAAIVLAVRAAKNHDGGGSNPAATSTQSSSAKKACDIFTLAEAKKLLGDTARGGVVPVNDTTDDFRVSTCSYTQDQGSNAPTASRLVANLLAQFPLNDKAVASNQNQFGPLKPTTVQDVSGYGDKAYWDPKLGQLNILKNNTWYILSFGPTTPASRSLAQTRQLADLLINKL